jgi:uncharacterized phiE125 gp8 family phage protein
MTLKPLAPPGAEPVSVGEARDWLRIGSGGEDGLIDGLIAAARERVEAHTGRALIARGFRETLDGWNWRRTSGFGAAFALRPLPLVSVTEIRVRGRDGQVSVWDPGEYRVDAESEPGRIVAGRPFGFPWPGVPAGGIEIDLVAGYGEAAGDVPFILREAVMRLVAAAYEGRGPSGAGPAMAMPEDVAALLAPWRRVRL